ncbi:hypothetical protein ACS0TY_006231 [Phlomoides rotata]
MKLLSYNVRGAGRKEKRREVRDMETKMEIVDKRVCKTIWGNRPFDWTFMASVGNSSGILTIWNT